MNVKDLAQELLYEGVWGGIQGIFQISLILIPVLILIEFARYFRVIEKISARMKPLMNLLTLPPEAAFPLAAGLGFGIVLGAALIIDYAREGILAKRDFMLVGIFLSINHSMVEDTLVFAAVGANPLITMGARFVVAMLVTRLAAYIIDRYTQRSSVLPSSASKHRIG